MNELHPSAAGRLQAGSTAAEDMLPATRALIQHDHAIDQLQDTIVSLEKTLLPVLRHPEPETKGVGGAVREAGVSPIHSTVLDMTARIQALTHQLCELRNRITV